MIDFGEMFQEGGVNKIELKHKMGTQRNAKMGISCMPPSGMYHM